MLPYEKKLKPIARRLRTGMTDAEQKLWFHLRRKQIVGMQFYRQKPLGPYVVDFHAPAARLVIEVDGSQHFESDGKRQDEIRDAWLRQQGLTVLRFDNLQVLQEMDAVLEAIARVIEERVGNGRG
jgi:very-short-patch-repair endonuclease